MGKRKVTVYLLGIFLSLLIISVPSFSGATSTDDLLGSMNNLVQNAPVYSAVMPGSIAAILCDFRRMFWTELGQVIVAVAVFVIGLMTITGKMKPMYAVLIIAVAIVFTHPEYVSKAVIHGMLTGDFADIFVDICQPL